MPNELGRVVCKLPMPPGTMSTLYKGNDRFIETYFEKYPGYYDTCDAGIIDNEGYVHILARHVQMFRLLKKELAF